MQLKHTQGYETEKMPSACCRQLDWNSVEIGDIHTVHAGRREVVAQVTAAGPVVVLHHSKIYFLEMSKNKTLFNKWKLIKMNWKP